MALVAGTRAAAAGTSKKKILQMAKGYRGRAKNCIRIARTRVEHGLQYQYRDRRAKKREARALWIQQINAGCRHLDVSYSRFVHGLNQADVQLNRKVLAELARTEPLSFAAVAELAKSHLPSVARTTPVQFKVPDEIAAARAAAQEKLSMRLDRLD